MVFPVQQSVGSGFARESPVIIASFQGSQELLS